MQLVKVLSRLTPHLKQYDPVVIGIVPISLSHNRRNAGITGNATRNTILAVSSAYVVFHVAVAGYLGGPTDSPDFAPLFNGEGRRCDYRPKR